MGRVLKVGKTFQKSWVIMMEGADKFVMDKVLAKFQKFQ